MATHGELAVKIAKANYPKFCEKCGKPIDSPMLNVNCTCEKE